MALVTAGSMGPREGVRGEVDACDGGVYFYFFTIFVLRKGGGLCICWRWGWGMGGGVL